MNSYLVLQRFIDNGVTHEVGNTAEFDDLRAAQLIKFGLISAAVPASTDTSDESDESFDLTQGESENNEADTQPKRKRSK